VLDPSRRLHPYLLLFLDGEQVPRASLRSTRVRAGQRLELVGAAEGGSAAGDDVRMRGFRARLPVDEALALMLDGLAAGTPEDVPVTECAGRVLAADVVSAVDVPGFVRSAMDGYAVRAQDTFGATLYDPLPFDLLGEAMPGAGADVEVGRRQACRIMTGAPVPPGADAVLRAESAQEEGARVLAKEAIAPGKNVGRVGEDIERGTHVLAAGRVLRPQDVGLLSSIGHHPVSVVRRPLVRILVSGNELLAPGEKPVGTSAVSIGLLLSTTLVARDGGRVESVVHCRDEQAALLDAITRDGADVIVAAGGSSVGREDYLPLLVRDEGHLLVHGVAMRPSSPSGFGRVNGVPVFLLPGNPVSCLCAYDFFAGPAIRTLAGRRAGWPHRRVVTRLARRIVSEIGRTDYARVALEDGEAWPIAVAGASVLSSTTRADGFVIVPSGSEGIDERGEVEVLLYDGVPGA
jgi:molybdopterin molybdotransferase